jgi:hypothetical protein
VAQVDIVRWLTLFWLSAPRIISSPLHDAVTKRRTYDRQPEFHIFFPGIATI